VLTRFALNPPLDSVGISALVNYLVSAVNCHRAGFQLFILLVKRCTCAGCGFNVIVDIFGLSSNAQYVVSVGADIANLVNLAAIEAVKTTSPSITTAHLRDALATVAMGRARKSLRLSPEVVRETAYHEAGHATVSLFTPGASGSSQMTVLPRGQSLGTTWQKPDENQEYSQSKEQMLARIDVCTF